MTPENPPTPSAVYIEIQHILDSGESYGPIDGNQTIQRLFHALGQTLRENANLRAQITSSRALLDEKDIEIFNKNLDLFNATGNLDHLDLQTDTKE
jgi:hypothetical protein